MFIMSGDSTKEWDRYFSAGAMGSSILKEPCVLLRVPRTKTLPLKVTSPSLSMSMTVSRPFRGDPPLRMSYSKNAELLPSSVTRSWAAGLEASASNSGWNWRATELWVCAALAVLAIRIAFGVCGVLIVLAKMSKPVALTTPVGLKETPVFWKSEPPLGMKNRSRVADGIELLLKFGSARKPKD